MSAARPLPFEPAGSDPMELVLSRLEHVRRGPRGVTARCPAHDDKSPSLSVGVGCSDGLLLLLLDIHEFTLLEVWRGRPQRPDRRDVLRAQVLDAVVAVRPASISVGVGSVEYMVQVKFRIPLVAIPSSAFVAIRSSQTTLCPTRSVHAINFTPMWGMVPS